MSLDTSQLCVVECPYNTYLKYAPVYQYATLLQKQVALCCSQLLFVILHKILEVPP